MADEYRPCIKRVVQEGATFFPKLFVDGLGDANGVIDSAVKKFQSAGDKKCGRLVGAVLERLATILPLETFLGSVGAIVTDISQSINQGQVRRLLTELTDASLSLVSKAIRSANPETLLQTAAGIVDATLAAFLENVGQLPIIRHRILSNPVNVPTLQLVWGQRAELVNFLVDIAECAKCFVPADGPIPGPTQLRVAYNELDVTESMNRHAIICQLQRLAKSVIAILRAPVQVFIGPLPEFTVTEEDTTLDTDRIDLSSNKRIRMTLGSSPPWPDQHWLFVNGIGGEYHWLDLACLKLEARFGRKTIGVFNRGDGILWDLVECAGERSDRQRGSTASQDNLINRTASSRNAQRLLKENLELMLQDSQVGPESVVVAHSQGCLLLRLVLEDLVSNGSEEIRGRMAKHLRVYTFGNPSIHWRVENNPDLALNSYSYRTEHFANKTDFVAKLGVLRPHGGGANNGYSNVFVNENWSGHLFGAQYSLDANDYTDGQDSLLLTAAYSLAVLENQVASTVFIVITNSANAVASVGREGQGEGYKGR